MSAEKPRLLTFFTISGSILHIWINVWWTADTRPPFSVPIDSLGYGKGKEKKPEEVKLSYHPTTKEVATYYTSYIEIAILSA